MDIKTVVREVKKFNIAIRETSITELIERRTVELKINCRIDKDFDVRRIFDRLRQLGGIKILRLD
jgi:hypothetical protein